MRFIGLFILLWGLAFPLAPPRQSDSLTLSPAAQGRYRVGEASLQVAYGTFPQSTRLTLTPDGENLHLSFAPALDSTLLPLLIDYRGETYITDAPGVLTPLPPDFYLIYFDTLAVFAQALHQPEFVIQVGMLEAFHPDLLSAERPGYTVQTAIEAGGVHRLNVTTPQGTRRTFDSASHHPRYRGRFAGQNLGAEAGFGFLGWSDDLPTLIRALSPRLPSDVPPPGENLSAINLWLPFDCEAEWVVTWGYHLTTAHNRYALDFAVHGAQGSSEGLSLRAAHAGRLYLKGYGEAGAWLDLGLAALVRHPDGSHATFYGHLSESTLTAWGIEALPPFEWVEVGEVAAGEVIGRVGNTGASLGAHVHIVWWTFGQSIERPVFEGISTFERGMTFSAENRADCGRYPDVAGE